jgi:hypothetical protein
MGLSLTTLFPIVHYTSSSGTESHCSEVCKEKLKNALNETACMLRNRQLTTNGQKWNDS